jgi:DNA-binding transcriptional MerR regulator
MKTVKEISRLTGVSVRTLHHYDAIGLLRPSQISPAGYRLYDEDALQRLRKILVYRELGLSLEAIGNLLDAPEATREQTLQDQIQLMKRKVDQLQDRISLAGAMLQMGDKDMNYEAIDTKTMEDYSKQAKLLYGKTEAYREYQEKARGRTQETDKALGDDLMGLFRELGTLRKEAPDSEAVQQWVKKLQSFITSHYYTCTKQILFGLGQMYADGGSMTENIDNAGGRGTGDFAKRAIDIFCGD